MLTEALDPAGTCASRTRRRAQDASSCRVVINADDFGLHPAVNRGIVRAHQQGVVTSASLIACGRAFHDAVERLRACPELDVGIHLTLVEECAVLPPGDIPSLAGADGHMPASHRQFAERWLTGRIRPRDVRRELEAQVQRVLRAGLAPTHLDSHQHVHCLPGVWPIVVDLAGAHGIPFVRVPKFASLRAAARTWTDSVLRAGVSLLAKVHSRRWPATVHRADDVRGTEFSGRMTGDLLLHLLQTVRPGLTELLVHPGEGDPDLAQRYGHWRGFDWAGELAAVTDERVRAYCHQGAVLLTRFSAVVSG